MPNKAYDEAFKLRAVAVAQVKGFRIACRQFGITGETLRAWIDARPADDHPLQLAYDLALSESILQMAEQKAGGRLSTNVGIYRDKLARYGRPQPSEPPRTPVEQVIDGIEAALAKHFHDERLRDLALMALIEAPEWPADPLKYVRSLGDLDELRASHDAETRAAWQAQIEVNRKAAAEAQVAAMDAEVKALVEAAERWLEATAS